MKKLFLLLSMLIVASLILAACQPAATPTEAPPPEVEATEPPPEPEPQETEEEMMLPDLGGREITIAVENAYLPFNYVTLETGEAGGWDYDFIDAACALLNCVPVWIEFGWDTMIASVADGQFDMATDGITITEERAEQVDFTDGYIDLEQRLLVRIDEDRFSSLEELAADPELLLSQQVGTTNYAVASEFVSEDRIVGFQDFGLAVQAVVSGDTDASVVDETAGQGYLGANADQLKLIGPSLSSDALGFIFPKGSDLVEPFNMVIAQFKADGTMDELNSKWFGKTQEELLAELPDIAGYAEEEPEEEPMALLVCQVTDVGGIDDKTFNATAWKGVLDFIDTYGGEPKFLESQQQTDYAVNINAFLEEGCDLIVTVGFLLGADTAIAAEANPDQKFAIVDFAYFDEEGNKIPYDNVVELNFATDQAAFLAGYVAAGSTQTGTVGTFGGIPIPPVTVFMDGFWYGVQYYSEQNGTDVQVLGWDPATQEGLFTGNFESTDDGRALGESLMDEGADIIMPVAGPVGLGTAAAVQERGNAYLIGVDTDMTVSAPEFADVILTSVLKNMDVAVFLTAESVVDGSYAGGIFVGTLDNDGVGLAPFNQLEDMVPDAVKDSLADLTAGIIAGDIQTAP